MKTDLLYGLANCLATLPPGRYPLLKGGPPMKQLLPACLLPLLLLATPGEPAENPLPTSDRTAIPTAKVPVVRDLVQPILDGEAKAHQAHTKRAMQQESQFPANFK